MNYLVRFVLSLYPPWWRERYGKETQELTEQLLADPDANKVRTCPHFVRIQVGQQLLCRSLGLFAIPLSPPGQIEAEHEAGPGNSLGPTSSRRERPNPTRRNRLRKRELLPKVGNAPGGNAVGLAPPFSWQRLQ